MSHDERPVFSRTAIGWMAGLTLGSLVFAFLWSGWAGDLGEPHSAGNDSYSASALGHRAFAELLSRSGVKVRRRRTQRTGSLDDRSVLILAEPTRGDEVAPDDEEVASLFSAAAARHVPIVIVLPKRSGAENPARPGWIGEARLIPAEVVKERIGPYGLTHLAIDRRATLSARARAPWGEPSVSLVDAQLLAQTPGLEPVVTCHSALLVARVAPRDPSRPVLYLVSDPDLVSTAGLGSAQNALVVTGLITRTLGARTVWFDETLHHPVLTPSLATEMLRYPLVLVLVQSVVLVGFLIWSGVARFGKARDARPPDESKRALVTSIAGLLRATGRPADTLEVYLNQKLRDAADRYGLPPDLRPADLGARLDEIAQSRRWRRKILPVMYRVEGLKLAPDRHTHAVVHAAREIHGWYEDMSHDH